MLEKISIDRVSEGQFNHMREEWNSLLERGVTNEIFLSWEWIHSWWEVFKDGDKELYILCGKNSSGKTIGIAPFYLKRETYFGNLKRNILRFCSSLETYPDHLDIITTREYEYEFSEAVLFHLIQHNADWDVIKWDGVHEHATIKKYLTSGHLKSNGILMTSVPNTSCPYLVIDHTFEGYLKSFSSKKRETLLRKRKILMNREKAQLKIVHSGEEPEKYIQALFALHNERAKQKGIKTTFSGEGVYQFHNKIIHSLLKDGKVVLAFLYKESEPIASYYCIKHNQKYYYYQAGLSREGEKKSAGTVLFSLLIENAFKENFKEFDFLRGNEEYKYFWTENYRKDYSIIIRKDDFINRITHYSDAIYRCILPPLRKMYKHFLH